MLGVTSSGICPVFLAHKVIGEVQLDSPAQAAMSEPPITPGSLRSSCHSGDPLSKSPNQVASSNSFISLGSFDTGKVFPLFHLVRQPTLTLSAWVCLFWCFYPSLTL
jgi:hypothetical protein